MDFSCYRAMARHWTMTRFGSCDLPTSAEYVQLITCARRDESTYRALGITYELLSQHPE